MSSAARKDPGYNEDVSAVLPFLCALGALPASAQDAPLELDPFDLVRVEQADHPEADATSSLGSLLLAPPTDGSAWTPESTAEVDVVAWEAIEALAVEPWQDAGVDGTYPDGSGVKVAVFDVQWFGSELRDLGLYEELSPAGTWDCYAHRSCRVPFDTLRPRFSFEMGGHGIACAEIIRDIAPGVELHLVRVNGQTTLENAVEWAVREGIDLISMSLSFFNQSFYDGSGPISRSMEVLGAGDTLMVTSAGNYATEHWLEELKDDDQDGLHEFPFGSDPSWGEERLPVFLSQGTSRIHLSWNDFFWCGRTDLDLYVYDGDGDLVGRSTGTQEAVEGCLPVERARVSVEEEGWHYIAVHRKAGRRDVSFRLFARGGDIYQAMAEGSIADPGAHPGVLTVGAIRARGYLFNDAESFSSQGPTWAGVPKPEIAGPNGVSSTVYGPTGFYGTSASTPAVVGALALLMSEDPTLSPHEAAQRLVDTAWTDDALWEARDHGLGAGHARLPPPGASPSGCGSRQALLLPLLLPLPFLRSRRRGRGVDRGRHDA